MVSELLNALWFFFQNGEPAYNTSRFDYHKDGSKIAQEDFTSISGRSKEKDGESYRNSGSYGIIAKFMKKYVAAYAVEIEKYFQRIVFNYLFCNGDAHLKNFSLQQTLSGDYFLSPAYDLINTGLHISFDSFFAMENELFDDDYETESFKALGFYAYDDFYEFGKKIGLRENRIRTLLNKYQTANNQTHLLIQNSFLSQAIKDQYLFHYSERLRMLNNSFLGRV